MNVAEVAGYSRATVYKHWPTRTALLRDAFTRLGEVKHHAPVGDLRIDLIKELTVFRWAMEHQRLDRALAVLADLTTSVLEFTEVRDKLVIDGEHVVRELLSDVLRETELDAATLMLCGAILQAALMHGQPPTDQVITASVDLILRGLEVRTAVPR